MLEFSPFVSTQRRADCPALASGKNMMKIRERKERQRERENHSPGERKREAGTRAKSTGRVGSLPGTRYQLNRTWGERLLPLLIPKPLPPPSRGRGRLGAGPRPVDSSPAKRSEEREREVLYTKPSQVRGNSRMMITLADICSCLL